MPAPRKRSARRTGRSSANGAGGIGRVAKAEKQQKARAAARDKKWLQLADGDEIVGRLFPTDEFFKDGFVHRVKMDNAKGKSFYADLMCLDQEDDGTPCPGCKDEIQRRYKFWTPMIVRDYEGEDSDKAADTVVIWSGGITIAKRLNKMALKHDLAKRDIVVSRSGSTKEDTEYDIDWEDEEDIPYSAKDKKLLEKAPDLSRYIQIREFDDFYKPFGSDDDDSDADVGSAARKRNPFAKKKKSTDDDEESKPRRRSAARSSTSRAKRSSSKPVIRKRRG